MPHAHIAICVRAEDGERIRPVSQVDANPNLADGLVSRERKSSAASSPPLIRRSLGEGGLRAAACLSADSSTVALAKVEAAGGGGCIAANLLVFTSPMASPFA